MNTNFRTAFFFILTLCSLLRADQPTAHNQNAAGVEFGHLSVAKVTVATGETHVQQGISEPRERCGLVKFGAGTLRLEQSIRLGGILTVQQGTLDLSGAEFPAPLRLNIAEGAVVKLPEGRELPCDGFFLSNQMQKPGKWGSLGSVAAHRADFETSTLIGSGVLVVADTGISARERWKRMKYGLFVHYVWDGNGYTTLNIDGSPGSSADYMADSFDAEGFANDVASMKVEYLIFTAWHSNFHPLFNSQAVERIPANERPRIKTPHSDMLGRMVKAVRAKGVRVLFYSHPGQQNFWGEPWHVFMEDIYGEMMDHYDLDGFYIDENDPGGNSQKSLDLPRIERAVRWRKPDAVMIQNFYGNLYAFDAGIGESGPAKPDFTPDFSWTMSGAYAQVITKTWSAQVPKAPTPQPAVTRSPEGIFRATVLGAGTCVEGGGWAWAAGPFPGNGMWTDPVTKKTTFVGRWETGVLEAMQKAGQYIEPLAESIKDTYPSTSWQPKGFIADLPWGVATRSTDDKREYVHVLKPPASRTLSLPPPDDGKTFARARLLIGGKPVSLVQDSKGLHLTLPDDAQFNPLDTVIAMDVVSKPTMNWKTVTIDTPAVSFGTREVFNNTATDPSPVGRVEYHGDWHWQARDAGEYSNDIHFSANNGDDFTIHFTGSGVMMVGNGLGEIDFFLDDKFLKHVNMNAWGNHPHIVGVDLTGLKTGPHTLKGVKVGGPWVQLDMFRVYNTGGGNWKPTGANKQIRTTDRNEDYVQFNFTGPGVEVIGPKGPDRGTIEVFIDGESVRNINQYHGTPLSSATLITLTNLGNGPHTLCMVKKRGGYIDVEAFRVLQAIMGAKP